MNINKALGAFSVIFAISFLITLGIAKANKWPKTGPLFYQRDRRFWLTLIAVIVGWNALSFLLSLSSAGVR